MVKQLGSAVHFQRNAPLLHNPVATTAHSLSSVVHACTNRRLHCNRTAASVDSEQHTALHIAHSSAARSMANSKYEYVKQFEQPDQALLHTWLVCRVDGRSFHK